MAYLKNFKHVFVGLVLLCGLGTGVQAQSQWEGGFFGAQAGYASSDLDWRLNGNGWWGAANPAFNQTSFSLDGPTYGVFAGYNWVSSSNMLVGVEFAYNVVDHDTSKVSPAFPGIDTWSVQMENFWDLSARLGRAQDKYMYYGALGLAVAKVESTATPPLDASGANHIGFSVGIGGAYMIAPKTSLGVEYKYYDFGSANHATNPACGPCTPADGRSVDVQSHVINVKLTKHF